MTLRQLLSSRFSQQNVLRLLYSRVAVASVGLATGALIVTVLWQHNPMIAILCIPMTASVLTALTLMFTHPVKNRRKRLG